MLTSIVASKIILESSNGLQYSCFEILKIKQLMSSIVKRESRLKKTGVRTGETQGKGKDPKELEVGQEKTRTLKKKPLPNYYLTFSSIQNPNIS